MDLHGRTVEELSSYVKGKSLYVMSPCYGGMLAVNYHNSFCNLLALAKEIGLDIESTNIYNESLISRARNRMVDTYLKETSCTHSIFIDADIGFDPVDVILMMGLDKDILGVPCSRKAIRWDRIQHAIVRRTLEWASNNASMKNGHDVASLVEAFKQSGGEFPPSELPRIGGDFVLNFKPFEGDKTLQMDSPEEMKHVGTGMLMIKREVFLKFMKAYPDRWYAAKHDPASNPGPIHDFFKVGVNVESREYDSEDYWFVRDCSVLGYKVLLLPYVKTTHMGTMSFIGDMPAAISAAGSFF